LKLNSKNSKAEPPEPIVKDPAFTVTVSALASPRVALPVVWSVVNFPVLGVVAPILVELIPEVAEREVNAPDPLVPAPIDAAVTPAKVLAPSTVSVLLTTTVPRVLSWPSA
jgi:hypothetical protein